MSAEDVNKSLFNKGTATLKYGDTVEVRKVKDSYGGEVYVVKFKGSDGKYHYVQASDKRTAEAWVKYALKENNTIVVEHKGTETKVYTSQNVGKKIERDLSALDKAASRSKSSGSSGGSSYSSSYSSSSLSASPVVVVHHSNPSVSVTHTTNTTTRATSSNRTRVTTRTVSNTLLPAVSVRSKPKPKVQTVSSDDNTTRKPDLSELLTQSIMNNPLYDEQEKMKLFEDNITKQSKLKPDLTSVMDFYQKDTNPRMDFYNAYGIDITKQDNNKKKSKKKNPLDFGASFPAAQFGETTSTKVPTMEDAMREEIKKKYPLASDKYVKEKAKLETQEIYDTAGLYVDEDLAKKEVEDVYNKQIEKIKNTPDNSKFIITTSDGKKKTVTKQEALKILEEQKKKALSKIEDEYNKAMQKLKNEYEKAEKELDDSFSHYIHSAEEGLMQVGIAAATGAAVGTAVGGPAGTAAGAILGATSATVGLIAGEAVTRATKNPTLGLVADATTGLATGELLAKGAELATKATTAYRIESVINSDTKVSKLTDELAKSTREFGGFTNINIIDKDTGNILRSESYAVQGVSDITYSTGETNKIEKGAFSTDALAVNLDRGGVKDIRIRGEYLATENPKIEMIKNNKIPIGQEAEAFDGRVRVKQLEKELGIKYTQGSRDLGINYNSVTIDSKSGELTVDSGHIEPYNDFSRIDIIKDETKERTVLDVPAGNNKEEGAYRFEFNPKYNKDYSKYSLERGVIANSKGKTVYEDLDPLEVTKTATKEREMELLRARTPEAKFPDITAVNDALGKSVWEDFVKDVGNTARIVGRSSNVGKILAGGTRTTPTAPNVNIPKIPQITVTVPKVAQIQANPPKLKPPTQLLGEGESSGYKQEQESKQRQYQQNGQDQQQGQGQGQKQRPSLVPPQPKQVQLTMPTTENPQITNPLPQNPTVENTPTPPKLPPFNINLLPLPPKPSLPPFKFTGSGSLLGRPRMFRKIFHNIRINPVKTGFDVLKEMKGFKIDITKATFTPKAGRGANFNIKLPSLSLTRKSNRKKTSKKKSKKKKR